MSWREEVTREYDMEHETIEVKRAAFGPEIRLIIRLSKSEKISLTLTPDGARKIAMSLLQHLEQDQSRGSH